MNAQKYMYSAKLVEYAERKYSIQVERWVVYEETPNMYWIARSAKIIPYIKYVGNAEARKGGIAKLVHKLPGRKAKFRPDLQSALYSLKRRVLSQYSIIMNQFERVKAYLGATALGDLNEFSEDDFCNDYGVALTSIKPLADKGDNRDIFDDNDNTKHIFEGLGRDTLSMSWGEIHAAMQGHPVTRLRHLPRKRKHARTTTRIDEPSSEVS